MLKLGSGYPNDSGEMLFGWNALRMEEEKRENMNNEDASRNNKISWRFVSNVKDLTLTFFDSLAQ